MQSSTLELFEKKSLSTGALNSVVGGEESTAANGDGVKPKTTPVSSSTTNLLPGEPGAGTGTSNQYLITVP